jgi:hypothetical protein
MAHGFGGQCQARCANQKGSRRQPNLKLLKQAAPLRQPALASSGRGAMQPSLHSPMIACHGLLEWR